MTKTTRRANAQSASKAHPDAEIFALAEQVETARKLHDEARDAMEKAEERCRHLPDPPVIIRTEKDRQLGLFVGNRVGSAYGREDVPALRALVHPVAGDIRNMEIWVRASAILEALRDLKDEEAREGWASGQIEARRREEAALDAYEDLAERLAKAQATTIEGVFAKARFMRRDLLGEDDPLNASLNDNLRRTLRIQGPCDDAFALSLARDLIHLAVQA